MLTITIRANDKTDSLDYLLAAPKTFKTGSHGYFGQGKVILDGVRYQAQIQLVEIGSKPTKTTA